MAGIVIIGAGECGVRAAFALREKGYDGSVVLLSAESVLPYERPPLSKSQALSPKLIRQEDAYKNAAVDLRLGAVVEAIDVVAKTVRLKDGEEIRFEKLLIATGARPRVFPGMDTCLTLRTLEDANRILPKLSAGARVGIIGGGFIGLELAASAKAAGADVILFEVGARLMGRAVPSEIAANVQMRHESEGVEIRLGAQVASADATSITLADGTRTVFDLVVAGTGALPNTQLAEAAGLEVENGIVVDAQFRTSAEGIYAAGDCCNFPWNGGRLRLESWQAAQEQGAHVAGVLMGAVEAYAKVPWFWSDQFDQTLQVAGLFLDSLPIHGREKDEDSLIVFQCLPDGTLCAAAGIGIGNVVAKDIRIFQKLIERGARIKPEEVVDRSFNLKRLLKAA